MAQFFDLFSGLDLEKIRTIQEVNEEGDFATQVINSLRDGVVVFDRHYRHTLWNPAMGRITGLKTPQVLGRSAFEVFPSLIKSGIKEFFDRALRGESCTHSFPFFVEAKELNGQERHGYCECSFSPIRDEMGDVVAGLIIVGDLTEWRRRTEELEATIAVLRAQIDAAGAQAKSG